MLGVTRLKPAASTLGQSRTILFLKTAEYAGLGLFILVVPRLMGLELYGRFAVLLSMVALFMLSIGLGTGPMLGRFVPEYERRNERSQTQRLFMGILLLRVALAGVFGTMFLVAFRVLLPETSTLALAAAGAVFLVAPIAFTCFQIFFGMNSLGKWLTYQSMDKPALLVFLIALGGTNSLERAVFALLATQLILLLLGAYWARGFFAFRRSAFSVAFLLPHLRFGLTLFGANLLLLAVWRGGEVAVLALSGKPEEVALFSIANAIILAFAALISQVAMMILPSLTTLHISGEGDEVNSWLGYSLKYLTIAAFAFLIAVHMVGAWSLDRILGEQFTQAADNLKLIAFGLIPLGLIRTGFSVATLYKQPVKVFPVTGAALAAFVVAAILLVPGYGSFGASGAVVIALATAGVITYFQFSLAPALAIARYWRLVIAGFVALGILAVPSITPMILGPFAMALFVCLLFWGKVIGASEIRQFVQVLAPIRKADAVR